MFFYYPYILLLLLVPFGFWLVSFRTQHNHIETLFSPELLAKLSLRSSRLSGPMRYRLFLLILVLFIIALARPLTPLSYLNTSEQKPAVILALDVSKSMHQTDIYPSRLAFAKNKLKFIVSKASGLQICILLYAKDTYMLYPLTQNTNALATMLVQGDINQTFAPNSNLFGAIEASNKLLGSHLNRHIVLLSDGGSDIPRSKELAYLRSKGIALSTLAFTPNKALEKLCHKSGGMYQPYTWGEEDADAILYNIKQHTQQTERFTYDIAQYQEYFQYPLGLALLLLLYLLVPGMTKPKGSKAFTLTHSYGETTPKGIHFNKVSTSKKTTTLLLLISVLCVSMISTTPLQAGVLDFWYLHQADNYQAKHNYPKAIHAYKQVEPTPKVAYNIATLYYQQKHFSQAICYYKRAIGVSKQMDAKIYHNIANAYVQKNKLTMAKKYYKKSLESFAYKVTQENLTKLQTYLKAQRKNLHKKFQKLHFKAIANKDFANNTPFTNYAVKLHDFIPTEEEKWFQKILNQHTPLYLQKIPTTQRSDDANLSM